MKIYILRHSPVLYIPVLGNLIYKLQLYLFEKNILKIVFVSRKKIYARDQLITALSNKSGAVICQSYKLGRILERINTQLIADFEAPQDFRKFPLFKLHDLAWTLILSDKITLKTRRSLGDFVPENFPVVDLKEFIHK